MTRMHKVREIKEKVSNLSRDSVDEDKGEVMRLKSLIAVAVSAATMLSLGACGSTSSSSSDENGKQTLRFWHNATTGAGKTYWENVAKAFEKANPNVTVEIQAIQNEDMDGKLQTGLQDQSSGPDVFMARGGQKLSDVVEAGQAMDLTDKLDKTVQTNAGASLDAMSVDGKVYGVPVATQPGGIWYSKDLFKKAGIDKVPTTMDEFYTALTKLKKANITPIAVGAKDAWPAAHWWYWFALRECSADTFQSTLKSKKFDNQCWLKAGDDFQKLVDVKPFNEGYLTTAAQQGANSSAGLIANHKAAMELMGGWDPGIIADLTPDKKPLADLGYFPFPSVDGGKGDSSAMMGGVDGFSCAAWAPSSCVKFLDFIASKDNQEGYATAFHAIPASKEAQGAVDQDVLKEVIKYYNDASSVSMWLDSQFGQNVGNALNSGVVNMLTGKGSPSDIVKAATDAAAKG